MYITYNTKLILRCIQSVPLQVSLYIVVLIYAMSARIILYDYVIINCSVCMYNRKINK